MPLLQLENYFASVIGVGDGGGQGGSAPQNSGNIFLDNFYVKFGYFSGKNHVKLGNFVNFSSMNRVKFGHFVNFSYIFLGQKCRAP